MLPELKTEGNNISEQIHEKKWPLRLAGRYLRPLLTALLFAQTLALPISSLAEDKNTGNQALNEYLVDIIIHRSLPQEQTENWARDTINGYINQKFEEAEIKQRLSVNKVIPNYNELDGCPDGGVKKNPNANVCTYEDNSKIRVWLFAQGHSSNTSWANPETSQIYMAIPLIVDPTDSYGSVRSTRGLVHEVGHIFKMPDYYSEFVPARHNYVIPIGISPYAQDFMSGVIYDHFSSVSKGFADRTFELPSGFGTPSWRIQYSPKNTIIKIADDEGLPMNGVSIEVFPQKWEYPVGSPAHQIIPNAATFTGITSEQGEFELGDYYKVFDNPTGACSCDSSFLRVTYGDAVRYAAITASYLNHLYFQGYEDSALISVPFSSLLKLEEGKFPYISAPGVVVEF